MTRDGGRRIVVTGAGGFIGRNMVARLRANGHPVIPIASRWRDIDHLRAKIGQGPFSTAIHLAWYAGACDYRSNDGENAASFGAAIQMAELLLQQGQPPHGVFVGSWAELEPTDSYGSWKRRLRDELLTGFQVRGLRVAWARLFNVVGPGEAETRFAPSIITSLRRRTPIPLTAGSQVRDFIDVDDVTTALEALALHSAEGEFDVATGRGTSIATFARALADEVGGADLLRFGAVPIPAGEVMRAVGDPSRLIALGWRPQHDLKSMARRLATGASADQAEEA